MSQSFSIYRRLLNNLTENLYVQGKLSVNQSLHQNTFCVTELRMLRTYRVSK